MGFVSSESRGSASCLLCGSGLKADGASGSQCIGSLEGAFYISSSGLSSGELTIPSSNNISYNGALSFQLSCNKESTTPHLLVEMNNFTNNAYICGPRVANNQDGNSSVIALSTSPSDRSLLKICGSMSTLLVGSDSLIF